VLISLSHKYEHVTHPQQISNIYMYQVPFFCFAFGSMLQHTTAYYSILQHTTAYYRIL